MKNQFKLMNKLIKASENWLLVQSVGSHVVGLLTTFNMARINVILMFSYSYIYNVVRRNATQFNKGMYITEKQYHRHYVW